MPFFDYCTTKGLLRFVSAHDSSFVFYIVRSGGWADEKRSLHDPMAAHSPWQPCAQLECAGSACSNDLISVLPQWSRWEHRCADCPLSHGTAGPTHAILHYLTYHEALYTDINTYIYTYVPLIVILQCSSVAWLFFMWGMCSMLPLKRGNMSQNPSVRRMHAHLCTFLYPSLLLACFHAPSFRLSLLHPHSPMCLHNHIVSHKHSMGEENEMVILVIGMCFSLNLTLELQSKPSHILATPQTSPPKNTVDGPSCYHSRTCTALSTGHGCSTGCTLFFLTNCSSFVL